MMYYIISKICHCFISENNDHINSSEEPIIIDINTEQYIDLNTIIELVYNYKLSDNINYICSICLEKLKKNENIVRLNCTHQYHKECIVRWLIEKQFTCPNCRKLIFSHI